MMLIIKDLFEKAAVRPFNLELMRFINFYMLRSELSITVAKKKVFCRFDNFINIIPMISEIMLQYPLKAK